MLIQITYNSLNKRSDQVASLQRPDKFVQTQQQIGCTASASLSRRQRRLKI